MLCTAEHIGQYVLSSFIDFMNFMRCLQIPVPELDDGELLMITIYKMSCFPAFPVDFPLTSPLNARLNPPCSIIFI